MHNAPDIVHNYAQALIKFDSKYAKLFFLLLQRCLWTFFAEGDMAMVLPSEGNTMVLPIKG